MFNCWGRRWIDVDGASYTLSDTAAIFSAIYELFLAFHALVYRWGCQFLSFFSQDNEHTKLTVLLFFQHPYPIFAHILKYWFLQIWFDFRSNLAIFPSVVQACTQPYLFGGRIKLIIRQIRHKLSVTIHEIGISWKKTLDSGPNTMGEFDLRVLYLSQLASTHPLT